MQNIGVNRVPQFASLSAIFRILAVVYKSGVAAKHNTVAWPK